MPGPDAGPTLGIPDVRRSGGDRASGSGQRGWRRACDGRLDWRHAAATASRGGAAMRHVRYGVCTAIESFSNARTTCAASATSSSSLLSKRFLGKSLTHCLSATHPATCDEVRSGGDLIVCPVAHSAGP